MQGKLTKLRRDQNAQEAIEVTAAKIDFIQQVSDVVKGYNPLGKGNMTFFVALTQADPCLAKLSVDGEADAIITDDSVLPMYSGPRCFNSHEGRTQPLVFADCVQVRRILLSCLMKYCSQNLDTHHSTMTKPTSMEIEMFPNTLFSVESML